MNQLKNFITNNCTYVIGILIILIFVIIWQYFKINNLQKTQVETNNFNVDKRKRRFTKKNKNSNENEVIEEDKKKEKNENDENNGQIKIEESIKKVEPLKENNKIRKFDEDIIDIINNINNS